MDYKIGFTIEEWVEILKCIQHSIKYTDSLVILAQGMQSDGLPEGTCDHIKAQRERLTTISHKLDKELEG